MPVTRLSAGCFVALMVAVPGCSRSGTEGDPSCATKPSPAAVKGLATTVPLPAGAYIAGRGHLGSEDQLWSGAYRHERPHR